MSTTRVAQADDTRTSVAIYGSPVSHTVAPSLFNVIFPSVGLPRHVYSYADVPSLLVEPNAWSVARKEPDYLGSCITMPCSAPSFPFLPVNVLTFLPPIAEVQAVEKVDELTPRAKAIGAVNTTYLRHEADGSVVEVGDNLDTAGVGNSLLSALLDRPSPFPSDSPRRFSPNIAAAIMIGGGGATRAAVYAMNEIGLSPIYLVNRDASETKSIISQFPTLDLRALETVEQVKEELEALEKSGIRLCAGTGAIPSIEPATEAEKNVYEVAKAAFSYPYKGDASTQAGFLALPSKPTFLGMSSPFDPLSYPSTYFLHPCDRHRPSIPSFFRSLAIF